MSYIQLFHGCSDQYNDGGKGGRSKPIRIYIKRRAAKQGMAQGTKQPMPQRRAIEQQRRWLTNLLPIHAVASTQTSYSTFNGAGKEQRRRLEHKELYFIKSVYYSWGYLEPETVMTKQRVTSDAIGKTKQGAL